MMEAERKLLIEYLKKNKKDLDEFIMSAEYERYTDKSPSLSIEARQKGNTLYSKKVHSAEDHKQILTYYCQSIALAPNKSEELSLAFGNRSAFLLHIRKYNESILDIDRALINNKSEVLKIKLMCRKAECLFNLKNPKSYKLLEDAINFINDKVDAASSKAKLLKYVNDIKNKLIKDNTKKADETTTNLSVNEIVLEEKLDLVEVKYDEKYGNHLVAKCDFNPGDIVLIEKCYINCLRPERRYTFCCNCLTIAWAGVPCDSCTWAMFCSSKCQKEAKIYHDIECSVLRWFYRNFDFNVDFQVMSRLLITGLNESGSITQLKADLQQSVQNSTSKTIAVTIYIF